MCPNTCPSNFMNITWYNRHKWQHTLACVERKQHFEQNLTWGFFGWNVNWMLCLVWCLVVPDDWSCGEKGAARRADQSHQTHHCGDWQSSGCWQLGQTGGCDRGRQHGPQSSGGPAQSLQGERKNWIFMYGQWIEISSESVLTFNKFFCFWKGRDFGDGQQGDQGQSDDFWTQLRCCVQRTTGTSQSGEWEGEVRVRCRYSSLSL